MPKLDTESAQNSSAAPPCGCVYRYAYSVATNFKVLKCRRGVSNLHPYLGTPDEFEGDNMLKRKLRSSSTTFETHRMRSNSSNLQFRDFMPHHDDNRTAAAEPRYPHPRTQRANHTEVPQNTCAYAWGTLAWQDHAHRVRKGRMSISVEGRGSS